MFVCYTCLHYFLTVKLILQDVLCGHLASVIQNFVQLYLTITYVRSYETLKFKKLTKNWMQTWRVFTEPVTYMPFITIINTHDEFMSTPCGSIIALIQCYNACTVLIYHAHHEYNNGYMAYKFIVIF